MTPTTIFIIEKVVV